MVRGLIVTALVSATLAQAAAQQTIFRAETDLVSLGVVVTDRRGNFLADFKARTSRSSRTGSRKR